MKCGFVLTFGVCGGKISIPFGRECVAFLLGRRARWWWWWDPPLRKLSQPIPIALQRLVPLATTEQIVSLLLELLSLPKLCLHQQCMYVNDGDTNIIPFLQ
jgi:hypothetical protein